MRTIRLKLPINYGPLDKRIRKGNKSRPERILGYYIDVIRRNYIKEPPTKRRRIIVLRIPIIALV